MSINVLFFARYAEAVGFDSLEMEGEFASVDAVRLALAADPEFAVLNEASLMCARNEELCSLDEPVQAGDEVAFFLPSECGALAKRAIAENAIHTCGNQRFHNACCFVEIDGMLDAPVGCVRRCRSGHDGPRAVNVIGRQPRAGWQLLHASGRVCDLQRQHTDFGRRLG